MKNKQSQMCIFFKKIVCLCVFALVFQFSFAQEKNISGTVTDESGIPLPNVTVLVKESTKGTQTDFDGKYEISTEKGNTLIFSYVGMKSEERKVGKSSTIDIILKKDIQKLDEVVVTALGIKRAEKSLPYATQKIKAKELTDVPSSNILSNLAGKTAGMMVSGSGSGVGSSVKVVLRGNRSIFGNNQPLYVVDGTPINSSAFTDGTNAEAEYGGEIDGGDGLAAINPNDIESINVLKGASAAALYGSQAANGVIMITTKKGSRERTAVSLHSSFQLDVPYVTYEFQDSYNMGSGGIDQKTNFQWGAKNLDKNKLNNDFIRDFFQLGNLLTNSVSISGGSKKVQSYFSYQNSRGRGIIPQNTFNKHNVALRSETSLLNNFINIEGSIAAMKQDMGHAPSAPGAYFNPIVGLYLFPEGTNEFNKYKEKYEVFDPKKNIMKSNWRGSDDGVNQNPYWLINRYNYTHEAKKAITKLNVTFNLSESLNLAFRGSYDSAHTKAERKVNWGADIITGTQGGRYEVYNNDFSESYADALLNFDKKFNSIDIHATLGTSILDKRVDKLGTKMEDLKIPNFFHINNFGSRRPINKQESEHRQLQAIFGTLSLGIRDFLYLDLTARNDWSSTLPKNNRSYFYPSVGTSFVFTELMNHSNWLSFGKLRFSWTQVGNDMPWGKTIVYDKLNNIGDLEKNTIAPFRDLKPERSSSLETGLNASLFNNRVYLDVAYYQTDTENQYFLVDAPSGTGFSKYYINAGKVRNKGWEITLGFEPAKGDIFGWNSIFNFNTNKNTIISLPKQYKESGLSLTSKGFTYLLKEGEEWGEMYVKRAERNEQGKIIIDKDNKGNIQLKEASKESHIGNVSPDFMLGWSNQFRIGDVGLSFQFDGRFGGKVISLTQSSLNRYGRSKESADARDAGGVLIDAVTTGGKAYNKPISAETYYNSKEGSLAMYDATNIRLRELSLSYTFPEEVMARSNVFTDIRIALIARNLFYIYRDAPFDPEMVLSTTTNSTSNVDEFSIPMSRNIGLSLNVNF